MTNGPTRAPGASASQGIDGILKLRLDIRQHELIAYECLTPGIVEGPRVHNP
jgi:hypothetical protein